MHTEFDQTYLKRLIEGDSATEAHFIRHFGDVIRLTVLARVGSWRLVEDVRQETFLRVLQLLRRQGGLDRPERLGAFVYSVCRRVLAEHIREEAESRSAGQLGQSEPSYRMLLDERLIRREHRREVARAMKDLAPVEREALRLVVLEERDRKEVGRRLGLSADYLRVVLHRAKARLRERLAGGKGVFALSLKSYDGTWRPSETATGRKSRINENHGSR